MQNAQLRIVLLAIVAAACLAAGVIVFRVAAPVGTTDEGTAIPEESASVDTDERVFPAIETSSSSLGDAEGDLIPLVALDGADRETAASTVGVAGAPKMAKQEVLTLDSSLTAVTLVADGELPSDGADLLISGEDDASEPVFSNVPMRSTQALKFPEGNYVAAAQVEGVGIGTPIRFSVPTDTVEVKIPIPFAFDFQFQLQDGNSEEPIPFAQARLERDDLAPGWTERTLRGTTDDLGHLRLAGVTPGSWTLTVEKEGYATKDATFGMPGLLESEARRDGVVALPIFYTVAETHVNFELEGLSPGVDASAFRIAHTHEGERVRFDADGKATLTLGYYGEPLYVKLWAPDGAESVFYLTAGLPKPGEAHKIKLAEPRTLEVDLTIDEEIARELDFDDCWIRVAFQSEGHERKTVGIPVTGDGVYQCSAVHSSSAMVSFITTDGGLPVDWVTQRVDLPQEGRTETSLVVDQRPSSLRFIAADGEPAPSVTFRVHQIPNTTGWTGSGTTDAEGNARVTKLTNDRTVILAMNESRDQFLMDVPIDLRSHAAQPALKIGVGEPTFIEAFCEGTPIPSTWFGFHAAESHVHYLNRQTDEHGRTDPFLLHPGSRAYFTLFPCDYWSPSPRTELKQGRNPVHLYHKAGLRLETDEALQRLRFEQSTATLQDWLDSGLVEPGDSDGGELVFEVPAGTYELTGVSGDTTSTFSLSPGEIRKL